MGEEELLLTGVGEAVWLALHLGSQKTLHHHFSWDFYLGTFLLCLQKVPVVVDPY